MTSSLHPARSSLPRSSRGSLLIVAMILAAVIGISLVSYIRLGRTSLTISNRALYNNAAMNLAENGLEEAMYSINRKVADATYNWDGWTVQGGSGEHRRREFGAVGFDQNASGVVRVYVYNADVAGSPRVVAKSMVTLGGGAAYFGAPIEKWVAVQLRRTSKFANGLVAKQTITFSGNNASVDSWNSTGNPPVKYSAGVRKDNGTVGSISVSVNSVAVQNADIFGYAATGGALPTVGSQGLIGPFGTAAGSMDMTRVSTDFTANFDPVAQPTGGVWLGNTIGAMTLGAAGATTVYSGLRVNLGGNGETLVIKGNVTLYLTQSAGAAQAAVDITGNSAGISIAPGGSLIIYTAGNVKIAGSGVLNGGNDASSANQPINFQLWGTSTDTTAKQSIDIKGNGVLSGVVYAPNGSVKINGDADVMGSVVANDITIVGEAKFHYDESLGNFGGGNPFRVTRWDELTSAGARATYASVMNW